MVKINQWRKNSNFATKTTFQMPGTHVIGEARKVICDSRTVTDLRNQSDYSVFAKNWRCFPHLHSSNVSFLPASQTVILRNLHSIPPPPTSATDQPIQHVIPAINPARKQEILGGGSKWDTVNFIGLPQTFVMSRVPKAASPTSYTLNILDDTHIISYQ